MIQTLLVEELFVAVKNKLNWINIYVHYEENYLLCYKLNLFSLWDYIMYNIMYANNVRILFDKFNKIAM